LVAADAAPCGFNDVVAPAKVSTFRACLASGGGAARLNLAVTSQDLTDLTFILSVV